MTSFGDVYLAKSTNKGNQTLDGDDDDNTVQKSPDAGRCVSADAVGAVGGAALSPLGAFLAAVATSIYDLYQQDAFSSAESSTQQTSGGVNQNNPYDNFGRNHNNIVWEYVHNNPNAVINSGNYVSVNNQIYSLYKNYYPAASQQDSASAVNLNFINNWNAVVIDSIYDLQGSGGIVNLAYQAGWFNTSERDILIPYMNTLHSVSHQTGFQNAVSYSITCENAVVNDQSLSPTSKDKVLRVMAVARNSTALYYNLGIK